MTKNTLLFLIILAFCPSFMLAQAIAHSEFGSKVILPENDYLTRPWRLNPTQIEDSSKLRFNLAINFTRFTNEDNNFSPTTKLKGLDFSAKARLNPTTDITFDIDIDDYREFRLGIIEFYYRKTFALAENMRLKGGINTGMLLYRELDIFEDDFSNRSLFQSTKNENDKELEASPHITLGGEFEYKRFSLGSAVRYYPEEYSHSTSENKQEGKKYAYFTFHTSYQFHLFKKINFTPEIAYGQSYSSENTVYINFAFSNKNLWTFEILPLRTLSGMPVISLTVKPFKNIELGYVYNQVSYTWEEEYDSFPQDIDHFLQVSYIW